MAELSVHYDDNASTAMEYMGNASVVSTPPPTASPTIENLDAAEETHQFDADAALLLNITLICCTLLVSDSVCNYSIIRELQKILKTVAIFI